MNVLIIGATFGIGYELGKKYLDQCDNLILLGRTQEKLKNLKKYFFYLVVFRFHTIHILFLCHHVYGLSHK